MCRTNLPHHDGILDLKVMVKACQFARKIAQSHPLVDAIVEPQDPSASTQTDAEFEAYVKEAVEVS